MKKKSPKKLELSKETLKKLEQDKLQEAHGGLCLTGTAHSCSFNCPP
jgi:hypothetical protein